MPRFGNIGTQYLDDSGDPLISGKLYFYEAGTTTLKTTYKDVNLALPNTNPVILSASGRQPNIFFDGSARVVLTDQDDFQIEVRDPEGAALVSNFDNWNPDINYAAGRIVIYTDGNYYRSYVNNNLNNIPTDNADKWEQIKFLQSWNSMVTYPANSIVVGSDGFIYKALSQNTNQDPTSTTGIWSFTTTSGTGGASEVSTGVNIALTNTDNRVQSITTTAADVEITLPDATTLQPGTPTFLLHNAGTNTYHVRRNGGLYTISVFPGRSVQFNLYDEGTAAGGWDVVPNGPAPRLIPGAVEVLNAAASGPVDIDRLTDTRAICVYATGTSNLYVAVVDSGGSSGTPLDLGSLNVNGARVKAVSSSVAVVVFSDSTGVTKGCVITISGLTPTAGSIITINAGTGGFGLCLDVINSTTLLCGYTAAATDQADTVKLTVSGSTLSAGTAGVSSSSNSLEAQDVIVLSSTKAILLFEQNTNAIRMRHVDITGTPTTAGTEVALSVYASTVDRFPRLFQLSGDTLIACYIDFDHERIYLHLFDASGTTPVQIDVASIPLGFPAINGSVTIAAVTSSRVMVMYSSESAGVHAFTADVENSKFVLENEETVIIDSGADDTQYYHAACRLTDTLAICAYAGGDTFLNVKPIEVYT